MSTLKLKIEDKIYTKEELLKEISVKIDEKFKGNLTIKYQPINPDDFHTDYDFLPFREEKKLLIAKDIVDPFRKSIIEDNFKELLKRIEDNACFDKVGSNYYKVLKIDLNNYEKKDVDLIVNFLNDIDFKQSTRETLNFKLDLSY